MTTYHIEDLKRLVGESDGADTYQHQNSTGTSQYPTLMRPTLESRIYDAVVQGGLLTRRQIADAIGVKKAPWVVVAIEKLVDEGYLVRHESQSDQRMLMYVYEVARHVR